MSARILFGSKPAKAILDTLRISVQELQPHLTILQVGSDPESDVYIRRKREACSAIGMTCDLKRFSENTSFEELKTCIEVLNADHSVSGYLLQLPLPPHLTPSLPLLAKTMDPQKDVDGFTAYNLGKVFLSPLFEHLPPATPAAVLSLLEYYDIPLEGRHAVIVGHSNLVGKPLAVMLLNRNATVTICHTFTHDLPSFTRQADILVSAVGHPGLITGDMVKSGAIVIDVGITRTREGVSGDVAFDVVKEVAAAITPVPGGVGPMTVACLLRNCVRAKERQMGVTE